MPGDLQPYQQDISHVSAEQHSQVWTGIFINCRFGNNDEFQGKSTVLLNLENPAADAVALQKRQNKQSMHVARRSSLPIPTSTAKASSAQKA